MWIPSNNNFHLIQLSSGRNFVGFTYGAGFLFGNNNNLFTLRYIAADEINIQFIGVDTYKEDKPKEKSRDIAFLYGRSIFIKKTLISASVGVVYLAFTQRGKNISGHEFEKLHISTISFPFELQVMGFFSKNHGFIFAAYAQANKQKSIYGV